MSSEENDNNTPLQVRELFRNFEAEPPAHSWDSISARLAGEKPAIQTPWSLNHMVGWLQPRNRLYPALTIVGLILIAFLIWLGLQPSNHISGQALAEQTELTRGTAYLFRSRDKVRPFDSVRFFRKMELDSTGHFAFRRVPSGSYLLRIHVHSDSPHSYNHNHGYYKDTLHWNHATLIHTDRLQDSYPVHIPKLKSR